VQQHDEVVLLGRQGDLGIRNEKLEIRDGELKRTPLCDEISAEEVATWAETINYEVTASILPRVTRVYLKGGQVVAVHPLVETAP
jgi:alanine racemase